MAQIELRRVPNHCGDMVPGGERLPYDMTADPPARSEDRQLHLLSACRGLPGCLRGCGCVALYAKCCWHLILLVISAWFPSECWRRCGWPCVSCRGWSRQRVGGRFVGVFARVAGAQRDDGRGEQQDASDEQRPLETRGERVGLRGVSR